MSTPPQFFNDCVDFGHSDAFAAEFPVVTGATDAGSGPQNFAYVNEFGPTVYQQMDDGGQVFEENPYGDFSPLELDTGYDSTATTTRTSTTPNTQASTRTTSTSGSNLESSSSSSKTRSHHRHSRPPPSVEPGASSSSSSSKKKKSGRSSVSKAKSDEVEEEAKRNRFLERNRIAASKCRQKKKEWVSGLEDQRAGLESKHSNLQMEYNGLLGEVSGLKEELMTHASCNDPNINQWLENEARKFVQHASDKLSGVQSRKGSGSKRHVSISSAYQAGGGNATPNIDPMLRSGALPDDPAFSPTDEAEMNFEHAPSMFGRSH